MAIRPLDTTLSRRERERRMRRQAILTAARAVFAEKGYDNATLDEIAERAEFGKGTLYNYFEDGKEGILFAIFDQIYETIHELIAQSFEPASRGACSFRDAFENFAHDSLDFFLEHKNLFMVIMKESHCFIFSEDPDRANYFVEQYLKMVDEIVPVIEAGIEAGELKPLPPYPVAHILLGNVNGVVEHIFMEAHLEEMVSLKKHACEATEEKDPVGLLITLLFDGLTSTHSPDDAQ